MLSLQDLYHQMVRVEYKDHEEQDVFRQQLYDQQSEPKNPLLLQPITNRYEWNHLLQYVRQSFPLAREFAELEYKKLDQLLGEDLELATTLAELWAVWHCLHGRDDKEFLQDRTEGFSAPEQIHILQKIHVFDYEQRKAG